MSDDERVRARHAGYAARCSATRTSTGRWSAPTEFTADFQEMITTLRLGRASGRDRASTGACAAPITLTALVALGREGELAMHVRAALRNGLTPDEIKEVMLQSGRLLRRPRRQRRLRDRAGRARRGGRRMRRAVVLSAVRTPDRALRRRARAGAPRRPRRDRDRRGRRPRGRRPGEIDDVYFGCANQAGEDNRNVARMAALLGGPAGVGRRRDRQPPVRLRAHGGRRRRATPSLAGEGDLFVAGGVESMSRAPLVMAKPDRAVPARRSHALRHHARLALPQPGDGGAVPARGDGRDGRERGRALGRVAARSRTRSRCARSSAGPRPTRPGASPTSSSPVGDVERDEHPRPRDHRGEARDAEAGLPRRRQRHGGQLQRHQRRRRRRS